MDQNLELLDKIVRRGGQGVYVDDRDALRFGVVTALSSMVIGCSGTLLNTSGELVTFDMRVAATNDRVETVLTQNIGAGWLLSAHPYVASGTLVDRAVYTSARLVREAGAIDLPMGMLFSGYLDAWRQPSFPFGHNEGPTEGSGRIRSITGTDPAAGVEISETVPTGAVWRVLAATVLLVTDATVANRAVVWTIDDGTTNLYKLWPGVSQTASQSIRHVISRQGAYRGSDNNSYFHTPAFEMWLPSGYRIRTETNSLQAGDNFAAPLLLIKEWLTS